jgi:hypothetical protein
MRTEENENYFPQIYENYFPQIAQIYAELTRAIPGMKVLYPKATANRSTENAAAILRESARSAGNPSVILRETTLSQVG